MSPVKRPFPAWVYVILGLLGLAPIVGVAVIGKYLVPKWYSAAKATAAQGGDNTVQYRGQTIQLSKSYADFDEYKNDPNNIAVGETERVQQLVENAPIAKQYPTREAMIVAASEIEFPGYGMSMFGDSPQGDGSVLVGFSIEIPRSERERIVVFRLKEGSCRLVDDFVGPAGVEKVEMKNGQLSYIDTRGKVLVTRTPAVK